jgi:phosphoesterase RecJ-like protein
MTYEESGKISELINDAQKIVILQADNPDGDSLGSALALEQILDILGKEPILYCGLDIPEYLKYMPGWDRVVKEIDTDFDLSIIVDTSSIGLFDTMDKTDLKSRLSKKPCIVLDHHIGENSIAFATVVCNKDAVSTGEVIYEISKDLNWHLQKNELQARLCQTV